MPARAKLSKQEKLERRKVVALKARSGQLKLPGAVREIRQSIGLTQQEFADKFGLTTRQLIELEKGRGNPTIETLQKVCQPFGFVVGFVHKDN